MRNKLSILLTSGKGTRNMHARKAHRYRTHGRHTKNTQARTVNMKHACMDGIHETCTHGQHMENTHARTAHKKTCTYGRHIYDNRRESTQETLTDGRHT